MLWFSEFPWVCQVFLDFSNFPSFSLIFQVFHECCEPWTKGERGKPPLNFFENWKKYSDFGKKALIPNVVLRVSCRKIFKCFPVGTSALIPRDLLTLKTTDCAPALWNYSFCKTLHLKCLAALWIRLCHDNCSVICTVISFVQHQTHSGIFRTLFIQVYSGIMKHIYHY